ncbi:HPP family protein [Actinokineospora sp. UTMC 2448]|uniref:CBS domain-containing protein n=1 Tax=Actinokineospora sp. UTMC 2448 TaxID=2268449 RepID=UPI002164A4B9|nr:CBS domain-containing protein [Actinokineospora sp. UTMC 2448]UVS79442.1 putative manganese-dependent inorganic pyrophosphatase [Actinokineospora sp. UTMC 2448]
MKARDVMTRPVVSVGAGTTIREAIAILTDKGFAALPVVDDAGRVIGLFSESDALAATSGADHRDDPVSTALSRPVEVAAPTDDTAAIAARMLRGRLRCVPVVEEGVLVGMIARRDLLRVLVRDEDVVAANVRSLLDDYAGSTRRWSVTLRRGAATVTGEFADEAERRVVTALVRTVPGVTSVQVGPVHADLAWTD